MKKLLTAILLLLPAFALADTTTPNYSMTLPTVGSLNWGGKMNTNFAILDSSAARKDAVGASTGTLQSNINAEAAARAAADAILGASTNTLRVDFTAADVILGASTNTLRVDFMAADVVIGASTASLRTDLTAETAARIAGDNALAVSTTALAVSTTSLQAQQTAEAAARAAGDLALAVSTASLRVDLSAETASRQAGDLALAVSTASLRTDLTSETSARISGDNALAVSTTSLLNTKVAKAGDTMTGDLYLTGSTTKLGLGTATPLQTLEIRKDGSAGENGRALRFNNADSWNYDIGVDSLDGQKLKISAGSTFPASNVLTITGTGLVGIGTATPGALLDVSGGDIRTDARLIVGTVGNLTDPSINRQLDPNTGIWWPVADNLGVVTGGVEAVRVDASQRVGIGTSTPGSKLDVNGDATVRGQLTTTSSATVNTAQANVFALRVKSTAGGGTNYGVGINAGTNSSDIALNVNDNADVQNFLKVRGDGEFSVLGSTFVVKTEGRVGVRTATPATTFDVRNPRTNAIGQWSDGGFGISHFGFNNEYAQIMFGSPSGTFSRGAFAWLETSQTGFTQGDFVLALSTTTTDTRPVEHMRLRSDGNVGIGTSVPSLGKLHVESTDANNAGAFRNVAAAGSSYGVYIAAGGNSSDRALYVTDRTESLDYLKVRGDGEFSVLGATVVVKTSGNVGIGTTGPMSKLQVNSGLVSVYRPSEQSLGAVSDLHYMAFGMGANNDLGQIGFGYDNALSFAPGVIGSSVTSQAGNTAVDLIFATRSGTTDTAPSERLRITKDGNVGVGALAPSSKLTVLDGDIRISTTTGSRGIIFQDGSTQLTAAGASGITGTLTSGKIPKATGTNTIADSVITESGGNIGINTSAPARKLNVGHTTIPNDDALASFAGTINSTGSVRGCQTNGSECLGIGHDGTNGVMDTFFNGTTNSGFKLRTYNAAIVNALGFTPAGSASFIGSVTSESSGTFKAGLETQQTTTPQFTFRRTSNVGATSRPMQMFATAPNASSVSTQWSTIQTEVNDATNASEDATLEFGVQKAGVLTTSMVIQSGNVGIGTSGPSQKLSVSSGTVYIDGNVSNKITGGDGSGAAQAHMNGSNSGGSAWFLDALGVTKAAIQFSNPDTYLDYSGSLHVRTNAGAGADSLTVLTGGNVGIGTTGPSQKLHISSGNVLMDGSGTKEVRVRSNNSSATVELDANGTSQAGMNLYSGSSQQWSMSSGFAGDLAKHLHIFPYASGNVGIGAFTSAPQSQLDVQGNMSVGSYGGVSAAPTNGLIVSGSVGIGTDGPATKLHVSSGVLTVDGTGSGLRVGKNPNTGFLVSARGIGSSNGIFRSDTENAGVGAGYSVAQQGSEVWRMGVTTNLTDGRTLEFYNATTGNTDVAISTAGRVGIGTTAPASLLNLSGVNSVSELRLTRSNNVAATSEMGNLQFYAPDSSSNMRQWSSLRTIVSDAATGSATGDLVVNTVGSGSFTEKMRLTGGGFLGIGTASPVRTLDVNGGAVVRSLFDVQGASATIAAPDNDILGIKTTNNSGGVAVSANLNFQFPNTVGTVGGQIQYLEESVDSAAGSLVFKTTATTGGLGAERMRITGAGNIGIGTAGAPSLGKLQVESNDANNAVSFRNTAAAGSSYGIFLVAGGNTSDRAMLVRDRTETSDFFIIRGDGNVGVGNSAPTSRFSVGASSEFQVNSTGNIVKLNNVTTSFPSSQGASNTVLSNNGSGTLSWVTSVAGTPTVTKYTVTSANLSAAALTNDIELFSLPAKTMVKSVVIKHTTSFLGGSISAYTVSVGTGSYVSGFGDRYATAFDVFQATGNKTLQSSTGGFVEDFGAAVSVRIVAESVGANLSAATQGSVDVYVETVTLP